MSIEIQHPESQSLAAIAQAIEDDIPIRRSPHVGNVNQRELSLIFGIAEMGASVQLEMVDTIQGDDSYSNPRRIEMGGSTTPIVSKKAAKGRVVGACVVNEEGADAMRRLGLSTLDGVITGDNVKELHMDSLRSILPANAEAYPVSEYFASIGVEIASLAIAASHRVIERPLRMVDENGLIRPVGNMEDSNNIFGCGDSPDIGALLPLEAMMAVEFVEVAIDDTHNGQIVHVAGPDMINYTKMPEIMNPTQQIAAMILAELGASVSKAITYTLPCMQTVINDKRFPAGSITATINSQYDVIQARESGLLTADR